MLLNNSSTSELSCLASRKRKLKKKRKMWLPERKQLGKQGHYFLKQWLICRDRSRTLTYIHNSPFYGNSDSYQLLTTVAKGPILDAGTGPRSLSDIHDILISYFLIYPFIWGRTRVEKTFSLNRLWWFNIDHLPIYRHEFSVSISCESKSKIYYELHSSQRKAPKSWSKNLQNGSCKLGFPNSSLEDDLIQFSCISIF